jgi:hypothetical protein
MYGQSAVEEFKWEQQEEFRSGDCETRGLRSLLLAGSDASQELQCVTFIWTARLNLMIYP